MKKKGDETGAPGGGRFPKGRTGNPKGRPKNRPKPMPSAFDILFDRKFTITLEGQPTAASAEQALEFRTYQDALAGSRMAQRRILKMITKREKALAALHPPQYPAVELIYEHIDPENIQSVLLLLDIAQLDADRADFPGDDLRLLLEPWAVQAALQRRQVRGLSDQDIAEIRRATRASETLVWPKRLKQ